MQVTVLVIIYRDKEYITIHDSDDLAWSELVQFVDREWHQQVPGGIRAPADEEARIARFFEPEDDHFIIGNADLTQIEAAIQG